MTDYGSFLGEYNLSEIALEFKETASPMEKDYILPETLCGSRVHLLLGIKNTRIQPVLVRILPSRVGVYMSPFKDVWGSRIIFAGPNKVFNQANKAQQRESNRVVYSLNVKEQLLSSV